MLPPKLDQIVHRLIVELHGSPLTRNEVAAAERSITAGLEQIVDRVKAERPGFASEEIIVRSIEEFCAEIAPMFRARPLRRDVVLAAAWRVIVYDRVPEISEGEQAALVDRVLKRASRRLVG